MLTTAEELWLWASEVVLSLRALHIPGLENRGADLMSQWDLPLVLEALVTEPFEPLELSSLKALSWKTALLLALTSAKIVSELTALSVHQSCLLIRGDRSGATLRPNPSFVPKRLRSAFRSRGIQLGGLVLHPIVGPGKLNCTSSDRCVR